jgi:class III poly(R)-hydroxyalkanoic acid synthase PhaE subunit
MNWNEQAETMVNAWTEGQKQLWNNWSTLAQGTPVASPYVEMAKQWHEMSMRSMQGWMGSVDPTVKGTAKNMFASQDMSMGFLDFITKAWQSIIKNVEAGQDWPSALADYSQKIQEQFLKSPQTIFNASQQSLNLWQLMLAQMQKAGLPWLELAQSMQVPPYFAPNGKEGSPLPISQFLNLYGKTFEQTFGPFLQSPTFGLTREINEKILKSIAAQSQSQQANLEYQSILGEILVEAFEQFMHKLFSMSQKGETITTLRDLTTLWRDVADPVFIKAFNSEKYIRVQGQYLNTMMNSRMQQREIIELISQSFDIPTRSEVDEAHRNIYEQGKEIKALRKELNETHKAIDLLRQELHTLTTVM